MNSHCSPFSELLRSASESAAREMKYPTNVTKASLLFSALLVLTIGCTPRDSQADTSPKATVDTASHVARGQQVLDSLHASRSTNGIATVDFKSKGIQLSLVIFPKAWSELPVSDQNALAALIASKAGGRVWRIFEGAQVVRQGT